MAIYQGALLFAVGVGPLPGGWLTERIGLTAPFLVYAAAGTLAAAVAWLQVPETRAGLGRGAAVAAAEQPTFGSQIRLATAAVLLAAVAVLFARYAPETYRAG